MDLTDATPTDATPTDADAEFQLAMHEKTPDELLAALLIAARSPEQKAADERKAAAHANRAAAQSATAALVVRQSAFPPLPFVPTAPTDHSKPRPSNETPARTETATDQTKGGTQKGTPTETPPKKKTPNPPAETPPHKKTRRPKVKDTAEKVAEADIKCVKCGSVDAEHPKHGRMLLCEAKPGNVRCCVGFHLGCLTPALSEVPASWYCDLHTPKLDACPAGCECDKHTKVVGKRARAPVSYF